VRSRTDVQAAATIKAEAKPVKAELKVEREQSSDDVPLAAIVKVLFAVLADVAERD
jgi:hypothetical protein